MRSISYLFLSVLMTTIFFSCSSDEEMEIEETEMEEPAQGDGIFYLALGDSYTIGQGVDESQRWPNQLSEKLNENGFQIDSTYIIARTGWTTTNLINAIENENPEGFQMVSLLIGVNNQFQGKLFAEFTTEFVQLLNTAVEIGGEGSVFVLSIPDYGVTPFGSSNSEQIAEELDEYNSYMRQKCEERNIPFVDVTRISRELGDSPEALASDNLHPSGTQYRLWMEEAYPVVETLLK